MTLTALCDCLFSRGHNVSSKTRSGGDFTYMAHLTKQQAYNIQDSNIALLGLDLEKRVRENAGNIETAWNAAGLRPGLQIWRIEKFHVVEWPTDRAGSFYDGDSYIILHTYKKTPDSDALSYDVHFWLGEHTTQDEAGTAAYKTVELDDHLHGEPVQYREAQGFESPQFLSYFPQFVCLRGGVSTGFHHVSEPPPLDTRKLYRVSSAPHATGGRSCLLIREVDAVAQSIVDGDVFVLDKGATVWQYNTKTSSGKERFRAAEFVLSLANKRGCDITVYDEGGAGAGVFLAEFGDVSTPHEPRLAVNLPDVAPVLFRLSDTTGSVEFTMVEPPTRASLSSSDAFLLDHSANSAHPAIYVWIGKDASLAERRLALQYAQKYLYNKQTEGGSANQVAISLIRMNEGRETADFMQAVQP